MQIEAYILVGGRSSRFGSDKALAKLGGSTLAERALSTASRAFRRENVFFVARDAETFAAEAERMNANVVYDLIRDRGPVGGLYTALTHASTDWILLFACDLTDVTAEYLSMLPERVSDRAAAVIPEQSDGRLQPLCALYNVAKTLPVVSGLINAEGKAPAMLAVIGRLEAYVVKPSEFSGLGQVAFSNVNHTEDLEEIERKLSHPGAI